MFAHHITYIQPRFILNANVNRHICKYNFISINNTIPTPLKTPSLLFTFQQISFVLFSIPINYLFFACPTFILINRHDDLFLKRSRLIAALIAFYNIYLFLLWKFLRKLLIENIIALPWLVIFCYIFSFSLEIILS